MNTNFKHKILAGAIMCGALLAFPSCDDSELMPKPNEKKLYQLIKEDPELTDFIEVINSCGEHCLDSLFNKSRVYTVWAPVNCGYHATDFKYGKLYQWGRKYGQGYENNASVPEIVQGPVSLEIAQSEENKDKFYYTSVSPYDWSKVQKDDLWNSGTESTPVKTEYDPCPEGWRVPTYAELDELNNNYSSWTTDDNGRSGIWFSGPNSYTASVPQVFFPAAGYRGNGDDIASNRGYNGYYWSSRPYGSYAYYLYFDSSNVLMYSLVRARGYSVRCVQVTD